MKNNKNLKSLKPLDRRFYLEFFGIIAVNLAISYIIVLIMLNI